ncbi:MAG: DUF4595 domain-containing protein [Bacteroidaceae bacterium]|nr:DUF4595 domain-containing protein [Bacteroidaceae bacterium]MBQ2809241.1 DUF4595 domain-containing protein [Bacteroidaceae bacterium]
MKKKFLLPVMALMLCVISCEDDKGSDNSSSSNPSKFKKLVSISTSDENDSMTFSYDKNGNLVSAIESEIEEFSGFYYEHITQYSWEGEDITVSDDYEDELSYTVKNGKIVEELDLEDGDITTFSYDSSGRLIKISHDDYYGEKRCFWSNDRLSSVVEEISPYESRSYKFYYSDEECKGFFPLLGGFIEDDEYLFRVMPQMIGAAQTALPSKVVRNDKNQYGVSTQTYTFEYTFYEDGYLKSCTEDDKYVYYFKWQ